MSSDAIPLTNLPRSSASRIVGFSDANPNAETRLREIGFAEGDSITTLHVGLFGRNPMSVRVNGAIIALRRKDARVVLVEPAG